MTIVVSDDEIRRAGRTQYEMLARNTDAGLAEIRSEQTITPPIAETWHASFTCYIICWQFEIVCRCLCWHVRYAASLRQKPIADVSL